MQIARIQCGIHMMYERVGMFIYSLCISSIEKAAIPSSYTIIYNKRRASQILVCSKRLYLHNKYK